MLRLWVMIPIIKGNSGAWKTACFRVKDVMLRIFKDWRSSSGYSLVKICKRRILNDSRYLLDSPYNLCRDPLFAKSNVSATSAAAYRKAVDGRLWSGSSWTAENSDFQQALIFDLGDIKNVTGIATQVKIHQRLANFVWRLTTSSVSQELLYGFARSLAPVAFLRNLTLLSITHGFFGSAYLPKSKKPRMFLVNKFISTLHVCSR